MLREGSKEWCRKLYESEAVKLVLYGRSLGLSHAEAEDVLQETFVALMDCECCPKDPEPYCVRAFRNRALNYRRSWLRRLAREWESSRWFEPGAAEDPREQVAMRSLASLPVEQREVIVLKIWHGYTFREIAALTRVSVNTAAGRYRYGLKRLRDLLGEDGNESEEFFRKASLRMEASSAC